jgi:Imidazolonepropionase and related amidohydrolases
MLSVKRKKPNKRLFPKLVFTFLAALVSLHAGNIVIRNVTLIDATGAAPIPHTSVLIRGDRIAQIAPSVSTAGAEVVDGTGKFLIPGLWDMHVHLWDDQPMFGLYVANGIIGLRDMGSNFASTNHGAKRQWQAASLDRASIRRARPWMDRRSSQPS